MNSKQVKKLRKKMKFKISTKDGYKPDYRIAKEVKKVVYFDKIDVLPSGKQIFNGEKIAVPVTRQVIVNVAKLPYRRVKKEFKKILKRGQHATNK